MTSASSTPSPQLGRSEHLRSWRGAVVVAVVAAAALLVDAWTPQVVSATAGYVALVIVGYWLPRPKAALALALLATPLIIIGHWASAPSIVSEWESWVNRGDTIGSVWVTAFFVWRIRILEQDRVRSEAQIAVLAREAEHRAKNLLANVKSVVRLSQAGTPDGLKEAIEGRVDALGNVHSLFVQSRWRGAELGNLVEQELLPYSHGGEKHTKIEGPTVMLKPDVAQAIAVALHELATNAAKYGALSAAKGTVHVEWSCAADDRVMLRWTEAGGPAVNRPTHMGFGTNVLGAMIKTHAGGDMRLDWRPEGLVCEIALPGVMRQGGA